MWTLFKNILAEKETVHYLIYEKPFKNYNEQISFFCNTVNTCIRNNIS